MLEIDENFPDTVISDKNRIKQVLLNLLVNANKFTTLGAIWVTCEMKGNLIQIKVKDDGIGIKEEDQEKLFTAFK
jgi:signal transduction histidine kinase